MSEMTASQAKQNFGDALRAAAVSPVEITRHGRVVAVLAPPGAREAERRRAREIQAAVEMRRLIKHQAIALQILSQPGKAADLVLRARAVVDQWERLQSCSSDYIAAWRRLLALPTNELAVRMCGDLNGWGPALRQNSPFQAVATP